MKSFFNFLGEARKTQASEKAKAAGLKYDSAKSGWVNRQGKLVARTIDGQLKFVGENKPVGKDQPQQQSSSRSERSFVDKQGDSQEDSEKIKSKSEEDQPTKTSDQLTIVFGRFNPPTIGHKKLIDGAKAVSGTGDLKIYPSRSQDPKKNPLDPDQKVMVMKKMYPDVSDDIINDQNVKTIFDALKIADEDGYDKVQIVVGSDRVAEFDSLSQKYNGNLYDFDEIETISAGNRDADAEGVEGMSASKMRKAAAENDFDTFRSGVPDSFDDNAAKSLMNTLRKQMNVSEGWNLWQIAPKFDWKNLRENYITESIFKLNSFVENLNTGLVGKVIRRGTNYLICVTEDNIMFKSWIRDLNEYTEVKMDRKMRLPGKPNTLEGTKGYFKYASDMTPGFDAGDPNNLQDGGKAYKGPSGKDFINKYKKKK
tara:strand:+ start:5273 stop:6547 length:1275 start_codon:yes stop_codon:yes gene_type:complete